MTGPVFVKYRVCTIGEVDSNAHFDMLVCEGFVLFP
jgi:hypothetical protein